MLSRMGIQRRNTDSWLLDPEQVTQRHMGQSDGLFNLGLREECWQFFNRDMGRHEHNPERAPDDHHAGVLRLGQICQQFRMAVEMAASHVNRFFIDRGRDHTVYTAELRELHRFLDEQHGGSPGHRSGDSPCKPPKGTIERVQHCELIRPWKHRFMPRHLHHFQLQLQTLHRLLHHRKGADDQRTA